MIDEPPDIVSGVLRRRRGNYRGGSNRRVVRAKHQSQRRERSDRLAGTTGAARTEEPRDDIRRPLARWAADRSPPGRQPGAIDRGVRRSTGKPTAVASAAVLREPKSHRGLG